MLNELMKNQITSQRAMVEKNDLLNSIVPEIVTSFSNWIFQDLESSELIQKHLLKSPKISLIDCSDNTLILFK